MPICMPSTPCIKFVIAAVISLSLIAFACIMLGLDRFKNIPLSTFCTALITTIVGIWTDAPKMREKEEKPVL